MRHRKSAYIKLSLFGLAMLASCGISQASDIFVCKFSDPAGPVTGTFDFTLDGTVNFSLTVGNCQFFPEVGVGNHTVTEVARAGTVVTAIDVQPSLLVSRDLSLRTATVRAVDTSPPTTTNVYFKNKTDTCPDQTFHLRYSGGNFVLDQTAPGPGTAKFVDSPGLSRAAGNPYRQIAEWGNGYVGSSTAGCVLDSVSPLHVWLGLRNSDDQGTNFDIKAEVYLNDGLVDSAEQLCIKGLTRNPALAQEITVSFPTPTHASLGDGEVTIKVYARIASPTCGGHANATGLRVYYDSADRDSRFDLQFE
jgi:hypothetical protein